MKKFFKWFKSAGLRSLGYLIASVCFLLFGWTFLFMVSLGVFLIDNIVTIKKLIREKAA